MKVRIIKREDYYYGQINDIGTFRNITEPCFTVRGCRHALQIALYKRYPTSYVIEEWDI